MAFTLLDMVQTVLSSLDSDEVNSINDTTESLQVAYVIRDSYKDIVSRLDLPKNFGFFELTASGSSTRPTLMFLPSNVVSLDWIKYNNVDTINGETSPRLVDVQYTPLDEFLRQMNQLNADTMTNVIAFDYNSFDYLCYNDRPPTKYTTFDDFTLVFDSYNVANDSTLQAAKTQAYGELGSTFSLTDSFVFPLDDRQYSLLLNEAKNQAFAELKQTQNVVAAQRARRGWVHEQHAKKKVKSYGYKNMDLPDYGWKK